MHSFKYQITKLYILSVLQVVSLTGAWVAILAARGFSLVEIGLIETAFHITSLLFEIPSGTVADVFGRKNSLILSSIMGMLSNIFMITSRGFSMVCLAIVFNALSYNLASGSQDALAYDTLKQLNNTDYYEKFASNQMIIYRVGEGLSTLCAGIALYLGHRIAYSTDLLMGSLQLLLLFWIQEPVCGTKQPAQFFQLLKTELWKCFRDSYHFLLSNRKAVVLMFCNSFVGAIDILLLFFLQAKLPQAGLSGLPLGLALFTMQLGGVAGAKLILYLDKMPYRRLFAATSFMVISGILIEHTGISYFYVLAGFITSLADDALQIRTDRKLQDMFPSEQRATLISIESFSFSVIMLVLSPLAGILFTNW